MKRRYYILTPIITLIILTSFLGGILPQFYLCGTAEGNSMIPTFSNNDFCIYKATSSVKEGDVLLYEKGNGKIGHTLVHIEGDNYFCQGDNNGDVDDPIKEDQILGKLIFHINSWKFYAIFISMIIGGLIGLLIITRKILRGENYGDI